jgi:hypothetical protein
MARGSGGTEIGVRCATGRARRRPHTSRRYTNSDGLVEEAHQAAGREIGDEEFGIANSGDAG